MSLRTEIEALAERCDIDGKYRPDDAHSDLMRGRRTILREIARRLRAILDRTEDEGEKPVLSAPTGRTSGREP